MSDNDVQHMLASTRALLFPSFIEGFGLPAVGAAAMGTPVLCSDLPVFRELLGPNALYADPHDSAAWEVAIRGLIQRAAQVSHPPYKAPTWEKHFRIVFDV